MGRETLHKRLREKKRRERKAAKRERREANKLDEGSEELDAVDEAALMERFRLVSERRAAGEVTDEAYEAERQEIFSELGVEVPES